MREKVLILAAACALVAMLLVIGLGNRGWIDRNRLLAEKQRLLEKNETLTQENIALSREIERLKTDLRFVEDVARRELGMVGKNEIIVKFAHPADSGPQPAGRPDPPDPPKESP